ncbi:hypothetical protein RRG08_031804 [Elysia crispata]|uniref:Uncharacterized protein n=1 Tax=Elysia crispata TaxID=231223 RepID=A0AAE0Y5L0_9GAST|nr:hypothetical protein RRG08_031804 [Elysia crispata]
MPALGFRSHNDIFAGRDTDIDYGDQKSPGPRFLVWVDELKVNVIKRCPKGAVFHVNFSGRKPGHRKYWIFSRKVITYTDDLELALAVLKLTMVNKTIFSQHLISIQYSINGFDTCLPRKLLETGRTYYRGMEYYCRGQVIAVIIR